MSRYSVKTIAGSRSLARSRSRNRVLRSSFARQPGRLGDGREPAALQPRVRKAGNRRAPRWGSSSSSGSSSVVAGSGRLSCQGSGRDSLSSASRRSTDAASEPALESARLRRTIDTSRARSSPRLPASSQTRRAVAIEQVVHPALGVGRNDGQHRRLAWPALADVRARSLKEHDRSSSPRPIRQSASSSAAVAAVRRRGEEHARGATRPAMACIAARRSVPDVAACASSMTTASHVTSSSGRRTSGRFTRSCEAM